jgi:hypothetical protein
MWHRRAPRNSDGKSTRKKKTEKMESGENILGNRRRPYSTRRLHSKVIGVQEESASGIQKTTRGALAR